MDISKENAVSYQLISSAFCTVMVMSNIVSAKLVPIPYFENCCLPAGLITYPITFTLSGLVTEIFGAQKAKRMVYTALGMNILAFVLLQIALNLPGKTMEEDFSFHAVLGLSGLRIFSSLTAYSLAQLVGIQVYAMIKRWTGFDFLWLRVNGSNWICQCVDTIIIDLIFLYWGMRMPFMEVMPIMIVSFLYKTLSSLLTTPFFYLIASLLNGKSNMIRRLFKFFKLGSEN